MALTRIRFEDLPERYAFLDPNSGKGAKREAKALKRIRARAALVAAAVDHLGRKFFFYGWAHRATTGEMVEQLFKVNEQFRPTKLGVEADGLQSLFGDMIQREAKLRGIDLPLVPVEHAKNVDKDFRIRTALQGELKDGLLFFADHLSDLPQEIAAFPNSPLKDLADAAASLVKMVPPRSLRREVDHERDERLRYLRATGADPDYIRSLERGQERHLEDFF